jgi:type IV secretory pathway VirB10-like protein
MADTADAAQGSGQVTDHRRAPRGVLPRRTQMWVMLGLAFGILAIILLAGQPEPSARPVATSAPQPVALSADRLRDYQDRLRVLDERARQEPVTQPMLVRPQSAYADSPATSTTPDQLETERKRREYESLFASNVVMSRRPEAQQLMTTGSTLSRAGSARLADEALPAPPSLDAVADAVMRASARYAPPTTAATSTNTIADGSLNGSTTASGAPSLTTKTRPAATGPITPTGPLHRLLEGTIIETVLTNRLGGGVAAPVNCLITTPVYSHDGQYVLIPAGSRVLGETKPVQGLGDTRLAVAFNRLALPDGRTYRLDQFMGLNDIGDAGLRDQVNQHYRSTFGASAAVGLITGFTQYLGSVGLNRGAGDRTVVIAGNVGDATAQATAETMNRFLNRLPTITIREGHRVKVYLTSDLELPPYDVRTLETRPLLAGVR